MALERYRALARLSAITAMCSSSSGRSTEMYGNPLGSSPVVVLAHV
ncbi:MAG: hypothetical protein HFK09_07745 [Clostridia bacterium]|nr:hypothetical protein [Clostridia bacterium]